MKELLGPQIRSHRDIDVSMTRKTRLELTWIGEHQRPRLASLILGEGLAKSHDLRRRVSDEDQSGNCLIHGEHPLALKALELEFRQQVKHILIDLPRNTDRPGGKPWHHPLPPHDAMQLGGSQAGLEHRHGAQPG